MQINSSFWVKFEEFGFYYRIKDGTLKQTPILDDGELDPNNKQLVTDIPKNIYIKYFQQKIKDEFNFDFIIQ